MEDFDMEKAVEEIGSDVFPESTVVEELEDKDDPDGIDPDGIDPDGNDDPDNKNLDDPDNKNNPDDPDDPEGKLDPPASWKKEMHESWEGLDRKTQEYFNLREEQMKEGLETDRNDATLGRDIRDIVSPYSEFLQSQEVNEPQAIKYLLDAHYALSTAPPERKAELIKEMAQSYGITLDPKAEPEVDPQLRGLQDEVNSLKSMIGQYQAATSQVQADTVKSQIDDFAKDKPYFDDVSDEIAKLVSTGYTLEDAYDAAVWMNPVTRQKQMDADVEEKVRLAEEERQEKIKKAKKAKSVNVRNRHTSKAPTGPIGSIDDTMDEVLREINSRS